MSGASVRLDAVRFSYGEAEFVFDAEITAGEIVAVMGASGSGKSTMLHLLAGFQAPQSGRIWIGDQDVSHWPPSRRPVTMVFQENNLFGHLDVAANVGLGLSPSLKLDENDRSAIANALIRTGLTGKEKRLPADLSGGERQRVALARAMVRDRPVLILDEPFASLGPSLRRDMLELVRQLHQRNGMTVIMVSHHPADVRVLADRALFISDHRISVSGPVEEVLGDKAPRQVADYLGFD